MKQLVRVFTGRIAHCAAFFLFSVLLFLQSSVEAGYSFKNGRLVDAATIPTMPAQDHFAVGLEAIQAQDWSMAAMQFNIVAVNFPATNYGKEAFFYLGAAYFYLKEYDFANEAFSRYLTVHTGPEFFQEAVEYKFCIAICLAKGEKRRCFGKKQLPKWACGKQMALQIYDEVIAAMPCQEIAARALVSKGRLLWKLKEYRGAVESFNLVIRRFPKHPLAPDSYVIISQIYLEQCCNEPRNPDILPLAQINMRRFARDFPREERLCEVESNLASLMEINARGLYHTGQFYERTEKCEAAVIYYKIAVHQFPETRIASKCRKRLYCLDPSFCEGSEPIDMESNQLEEELPELDEAALNVS